MKDIKDNKLVGRTKGTDDDDAITTDGTHSKSLYKELAKQYVATFTHQEVIEVEE